MVVVSYNKQLQFKQDYVNSLLSRFGKVNDVLACDIAENYRNKVQVSFAYDERHRVLCGNYISSTHTIVPIDDCMICDENANSILVSIVKLVNKYKISIFDENSMRGCLRHVLIRTTNTNEYMVVLITGTMNINKRDLFIKDLLKFNPKITTIVQNINNKHTSMILGNKSITLYGKGYVVDELFGLKFRVSSSSFYQVNKYQTGNLYNEAIKAANLNKNDIVIDAYCDTGTIGLYASKFCKEVLRIEINKHAVKDAIINMKNNKINNASFICDDASKYMNVLANNKTKVDVVIMDPPRTGTDKRFMNAIFKLKPNRVVYVSCNPETLKDNLSYLTKLNKIKNIQPIDMFPYTKHVECVVGMQRK